MASDLFRLVQKCRCLHLEKLKSDENKNRVRLFVLDFNKCIGSLFEDE
jgi:hypothetical protein